MKIKGLKSVFLFKGYVLEKVHFSAEIVQAYLRRDKRHAVKCPDCGCSMTVRRETTQAARDLAFGPAIHVLLVYPAVQGYCARCAKRATVRPAGIQPHTKATWRLMKFAMLLCRHMPNTALFIARRYRRGERFWPTSSLYGSRCMRPLDCGSLPPLFPRRPWVDAGALAGRKGLRGFHAKPPCALHASPKARRPRIREGAPPCLE